MTLVYLDISESAIFFVAIACEKAKQSIVIFYVGRTCIYVVESDGILPHSNILHFSNILRLVTSFRFFITLTHPCYSII